MTIQIDRSSDPRYYNLKSSGSREHQILWNVFEQYYKSLVTTEIGKFFRDQRTQWNYDLFYASQTTSHPNETQDRCKTNFLDPNYGVSSTAEEADYFNELMANYGWYEAGVAAYIKYAIEELSKLKDNDISNEWLKDLHNQIKDDVETVESVDFLKQSILELINILS